MSENKQCPNWPSCACGYQSTGRQMDRCGPKKKPDIEIISQHSNQIGGVRVTFTVGRLGKRCPQGRG